MGDKKAGCGHGAAGRREAKQQLTGLTGGNAKTSRGGQEQEAAAKQEANAEAEMASSSH